MRQYAGLAVFVLCSILGAQQAGDEDLDKAAIVGKVVDAVSGEPLKKATVMAVAIGSREPPTIASTDAEGKFAIDGLAAGRYQISADRNGYALQVYGQRHQTRAGPPLTLKPGQKMTEILFRLDRAAVITGRVVDEDNDPVADAQVSAVRLRYLGGKRTQISAGRARTNDLGEYRIYGLSAGRQYVSVAIQGQFDRYSGTRVVSDSSQGYLATYFPGVLDINQAVAIDTRPGRETPGIDIKVVPHRVLQVSGIVVGEATGGPARNVMVAVVPRNMRDAWSIATPSANVFIRDDSGTFKVKGLTPGEYWLVARSGNLTARTALDVTDRDVSGVRLALGPTARLSGTIRLEGDGKIDLANLQVTVRPSIRIPIFGSGLSVVKPDGSFELTGLAADDYDVAVRGGPDNSYLKSATIRDQDVLEPGITVNATGTLDELQLVLSGHGGRIDGVVTNAENKPQPGAQVVLCPAAGGRRRASLTKTVVADQYGSYVFRGITPGEYTLYAWDEVELGAWDDPDFMASYKNDGEGIKVEEGSTLQKDLPLIVSGSR